MDKHCVSLELARELKEVRWKKKTEFWYVALLDHETSKVIRYSLEKWGRYPSCVSNEMWTNEEDNLPAPLTTEILEELPRDGTLKIYSYASGFRVVIDRENGYGVEEEYLPNALARMWLYLLH